MTCSIKKLYKRFYKDATHFHDTKINYEDVWKSNRDDDKEMG